MSQMGIPMDLGGGMMPPAEGGPEMMPPGGGPEMMMPPPDTSAMPQDVTGGLPSEMEAPLEEVSEAIADEGRGGDRILGHLTPGEIVIPVDLIDEDVLDFLSDMFGERGISLDQYTVGNEENNLNPETGNPEFYFPMVRGRADPREPYQVAKTARFRDPYRGKPIDPKVYRTHKKYALHRSMGMMHAPPDHFAYRDPITGERKTRSRMYGGGAGSTSPGGYRGQRMTDEEVAKWKDDMYVKAEEHWKKYSPKAIRQRKVRTRKREQAAELDKVQQKYDRQLADFKAEMEKQAEANAKLADQRSAASLQALRKARGVPERVSATQGAVAGGTADARSMVDRSGDRRRRYASPSMMPGSYGRGASGTRGSSWTRPI